MWSVDYFNYIVVCVAISVPNLGILISLIGAFASTSLALVFPVLIELVVSAQSGGSGSDNKECGIGPWLWIKSVVILLIAALGCFLGTYENIVHIVRLYD